MEHLGLDIDPFANDPGHWGASLANNAEVMVPCLDAVGAKSIAEVGAYAGDLTGLLVQWAAKNDARVVAVDPFPQPELVELDEKSDSLELIRQTSLEALPEMPLTDVIVLDGDHNYWTLSEELRLIAERVEGDNWPLLLFHDVGWPHARRDDYYNPELIPEENRQPYANGGGVFPGIPGLRWGGLPYHYPALEEGGPENGVLTAVEDFAQGTEGLKMAVVPSFFGFGLVWHEKAPWADKLGAVVGQWDKNPLVQRLETNRVAHLATSHLQITLLGAERERAARMEVLLARFLDSSAFAVAERLSQLRIKVGIGKHEAELSKDDIRSALERDPRVDAELHR